MKRLQNLLVISLICGICSCEFVDRDRSSLVLEEPPYGGLTDSIKQYPENASLYAQRAILLSQHNRHELATADYKKAWELDPGERSALMYISNLLLVDETAEAVNLLQECIATYPNSIELQRRLSEIYAQTGQNVLAVQQYDKLLVKDSLDFEVWFEKGILLSRLKDTVAAIAALERSYALQPINYTGLALASLYATTHNSKALEVCDELMQRDTTNIVNDILYIRGVYYSDSRQYEKALEQFNECIRRNWKFADAYIEKGIVLYDQKLFNDALDVFTMAATVANTNPDAYYWMGRCYEKIGKDDLALINYERALAIEKDFKEAAEGIRRLKS